MDPQRENRVSPLWRHLFLWVAFLLLIGVGVVTVLLPELSDADPDEDPMTQPNEPSPSRGEAPASP